MSLSIETTGQASEHFTWHELILCPQWGREATEKDGLNDEILQELLETAKVMDTVRDYFNASINVHCCFRPELYNQLVKGARNSAHKFGMAIDFDVSGFSCKDAIQKILNDGKLEEWNMRMENNGSNPTWIHLDRREVLPGGHRYFIP
jgi:hypothetical protein